MRIADGDIARRGILFIVSGPSGAGKTSISGAALEQLPGFHRLKRRKTESSRFVPIYDEVDPPITQVAYAVKENDGVVMGIQFDAHSVTITTRSAPGCLRRVDSCPEIQYI